MTSQSFPGRGPRWASAPALAFLVVIVGGPLILIFLYSWLSRARFGVGISWTISTDGYRKVFIEDALDGTTRLNAQYLRIIGNSLLLAAITTVATLVVAIPMSIWMATRAARFRSLLVLAVTIPFWTNTLVRTYAWMLILRDNGIVNNRLVGWGIFDQPVKLLYTNTSTLIGLVYTFLPFMVLPIYSSAERFDFRLAEAAVDLGARKRQVVARVIWPNLRSGVIAGVALVLVPATGAFLQPELLGGGKSLMIGNLIQQQFAASRNWPFGAALSIMLLLVVGIVLVISRLVGHRSTAPSLVA